MTPHLYLLCQQLDCIKEWGRPGSRPQSCGALSGDPVPCWAPFVWGALTCLESSSPLLQRFLPFSRWFPLSRAHRSLKRPDRQARCAPIQTSVPSRLCLKLAQPGLLSHPRLDWGLRPCRRPGSCRLFVVLSSSFPHPTRLHVGQGRVCVISLFQDRALDLASSMKRRHVANMYLLIRCGCRVLGETAVIKGHASASLGL